jgi:hypothetical protein
VEWAVATPSAEVGPGARDVLGRTGEIADRGAKPVMIEMRRLMGGNLLNRPRQRWLPRRRTQQPEAGRCWGRPAQTPREGARWRSG